MSHLFGRSQNGLHHHHKSRRSPLPSFSSNSNNAAINEKLFPYDDQLAANPSSAWTTVLIPLPFGRQPRKFKFSVPIPPRLYIRLRQTSKLKWKLVLVLLGCLVVFGLLIGTGKKKGEGDKGGGQSGGGWPNPFKDPDTVVFTKEEIRSVWEWEVMSGHWPSSKPVPQSNLPPGYVNPALPYSSPPSTRSLHHYFLGSGSDRVYRNLSVSLDPQSNGGFAYPKRPEAGSIADLDILLKECDFGKGAYVRDCLEVLRIGGNLDNGRRIKRGDLSPWSYVFTEEPSYASSKLADQEADQRSRLVLGLKTDASLPKRADAKPKVDQPKQKLELPLPYPARPPPTTPSQPCDPNRPRLFHIFWAGPFTDKPYMAILSFLYTQNLGLDLPQSQWVKPQNPPVCRPQFLVWINPGHAASVPNPAAKREMYQALATNPWSAPFLHPRFKDVVKFKMWNTTEQLDGVPELKDHWRSMPILNSGGYQYIPPTKDGSSDEDEEVVGEEGEGLMDDDELLAGVVADLADGAGGDRKPKPPTVPKISLGASEKDYDKLSTVLSDMVRFVLLHRFGGIYLDADNLLLRDWEELWNWKGAFAYRWSKHDKYNTAIIKMHKKSALTSFLFKTALENKMDFHPMTISRYLDDAGLDPLLYRLPDALFDSAWLNMEGFQKDRPPFPYFSEFKKFFVGDKQMTAEPQPAGFDSFFRGAFCYHYHNNWWFPFDPSRNWPDLGRRFIRGERLLREAISASKKPSRPSPLEAGEEGENVGNAGNGPAEPLDTSLPENAVEPAKRRLPPSSSAARKGEWADRVEDDDRDLAWATVVKRTFEAYVRGEAPNMYGEWLRWE